MAATLRERGQLAPAVEAQHRFFLSDEPRNFQRVAEAFLGRPLPAPTIVDETEAAWIERAHADVTLGIKGGRR
jgi:hypothetical protein